MSTDLFEQPEGASPLDPDDAEGLIPTWIATRADLNAAEQENIVRAVLWASTSAALGSLETLLTEESMRALHRQMFGEVWKWAGSYRRHDTNLGTHWPYVPAELGDLLADVRVQTADPSDLPCPPDELAIRFHHRLVTIHAFPNGNGRHARLTADLLAERLGRPAFTWGATDLMHAGASRTAYLSALRHADESFDYEPLVRFARS